MRTHRLILVTTLALVLRPAAGARAQCESGCPLPGGGPAAQDCHAEFAATALQLNFPPHDPTNPRPSKQVRCFDGEPGCDLDGVVNGECLFDVDVCLHVADESLPSCTPAEVTRVRVANTGADPDLASLQEALDGLLPATTRACTDGQTLRVPAQGRLSAHGRRVPNRKLVRLEARTVAGTDRDRLALGCERRRWPLHGYDSANRRATPEETRITVANAAALELKWELVFTDRPEGGGAKGVTATPTYGNGTLYVPSWNGILYALAPRTGRIKWSHNTGAGIALGIQNSATLTADGRVLVGTGTAMVQCLNARTGKLLWSRTLGNIAVDHIWAAPAVANNRVFVGVASHSDNPCTQGRLVALDLDTGAPLWELKTVPDKICNTDTARTCQEDADCDGGTCIAGLGAGITATVAVDPTGEFVYMNTVGCYTFPSIGDSDSIVKVEAATGAVLWKNRVQPPEQFGFCSGHGSIDCGTNAACPTGSTCTTKSFYHDFGFINGPLLVDADDGMGGRRPLVASASKDGTLYALDPDDGEIVWKRAVAATPVTPGFAGFGLFNGAIGFVNDTFYGALYQLLAPLPPGLKHLMAFSAMDGATIWDAEIGISWGHVTLANGVLFVGTQATDEFFIYDATTGDRLRTLPMPAETAGGASIVDDMVFVPYGVFGTVGGVQAFGLP